MLGGAVPPRPDADHPRLPHTVPAGRREILVAGHLFIPQKLVRKKRMPLLVHFHGAAWVAETAAAKDGRWAVISVETGESADVYSRQFSDHALFGKMLDEASRKTGIHLAPSSSAPGARAMAPSAKFWKCPPITAGWIRCF